MIFRHVGRRHEKGRLGHQTEFRHRAGPAARNDQISRRISVIHAVDECPLPDIRRRMLRQKLAHLPLVIFARLPDHLHRRSTALPQNPGLHHLVERPRTERPAHDEQHRQIVPEAEMRQRLAAIRTRFRKTSPQRVARHHDLLLREKAFHPLIRHADRAGTLGQQLVGDSRIGVLLLNHGRNPHPLRRPQHRAAGIPSETDDHIGPEVADGAPGLADAFEHLERHRQVFQIEAALQARNGQTDDPVSQCRHLLHLHLAFGTDEEDLDFLPEAPSERFGHSHGRIDMTARAAARNNDSFHILFSFPASADASPPA